MILGGRLVAAVGHAAGAVGTTDDCAQYPECVLEWHSEACVVGIHDNVRAGLDFGDPLDAPADVVGPRAAARYDLAGQSGVAQPRCRRDEPRHGCTRALLALTAIGQADEMALITHDAAQYDAA